MNCHSGMRIVPKKPRPFGYAEPQKDHVRRTEKSDLQIGDKYEGLPIVGMTDELYICKHKTGWTECFQKKNHRFGLREDFYYAN